MLTRDFNIGPQKINRLTAVKTVAGNFMKHRPNDRIGVIVFAGQPYILAPLTWDHDWVMTRLGGINKGSLDDAGTAIGAALAVSANRLRESGAKSKVVILLTDGINNSGTIMPETAANALRQLGTVLYAIGAGSPGEIDERLMANIAQTTGGRYFRAGDTQTLTQIFERINRMAKTSRSAPRYGEYYEIYPYLLSVAWVLLFFELVLTKTVLRRIHEFCISMVFYFITVIHPVDLGVTSCGPKKETGSANFSLSSGAPGNH
jgi:Ca-activated chloride channel family protein